MHTWHNNINRDARSVYTKICPLFKTVEHCPDTSNLWWTEYNIEDWNWNVINVTDTRINQSSKTKHSTCCIDILGLIHLPHQNTISEWTFKSFLSCSCTTRCVLHQSARGVFCFVFVDFMPQERLKNMFTTSIYRLSLRLPYRSKVPMRFNLP